MLARTPSAAPRSRSASPGALLAATLLAALVGAAPLRAQYFGRNQVHYETFDFHVMHTPHWSLYFYPQEEDATREAARMAERWYARYSPLMNHSFSGHPIVLYANHPDFEQNNITGGPIGEETGGVTESLHERVVLPFTGVNRENNHVLGHEIVHVFQYDIAGMGAQSQGGATGLNRLPLWLVEGMAEYLSLGRDDPLTAMWLRDAALNNDLPTIKQLTTDSRYFPYRYGEALWAYIGGRWGDQAVNDVYRNAVRMGWDPALRKVLGLSSDDLSKQWIAAIRSTYTPLMEGRSKPGEVGQKVLAEGQKYGDMNVSPAVSPDGKYVAFFSRRGLFSIDLFLADARTGKVLKKLVSTATDPHFDAVAFINSAGTWSPDGRYLAFVVFAHGDNQLAILDTRSLRVTRQVDVKGVGAITNPAWGPDGHSIAFSGSRGGLSDLFIYDIDRGTVRQLTDDPYTDIEPAWSPDGKTLAWVTDRGPTTDLASLTFGPMQIATMDVATGTARLLPLFPGADNINPQYAPDGRSIFFVADPDGFSDIYRASLADGTITRVTRMATGVSGITDISPALTVAMRSGRMLFSVFNRGGYDIYGLQADSALGQPLPTGPVATTGGILPPVSAQQTSVVEAYLRAPTRGLPSATTDYAVSDYHPSLHLDYVGQPTFGVAVNRFGSALGGGASAYFSDMLGNRALGVAVQANGTFRDIGGEAFYQNLKHRWQWAVGAGHYPYLTGYETYGPVDMGNGQIGTQVNMVLQRVFLDQGTVIAQYPFSTTRRFETSLGFTRVSYNFQTQQVIYDPISGQELGQTTHDTTAPPPIAYAEASAALVGDASFFGFTSPIMGWRYRFEVDPAVGQLNFETLLADYRRYFFLRPLTFAIRGLHYGRYGHDADNFQLTPLYLGDETLIRGYAPGSFSASECTPTASDQCPEFDRLIGNRIAVANAEFRVPLLGTSEFGLINFPYLPTELAIFGDGGLAWSANAPPELRFSRSGVARVPVFSAGGSLRFNLFGYIVLEAYVAHPFERPGVSRVFGINLAPGW